MKDDKLNKENKYGMAVSNSTTGDPAAVYLIFRSRGTINCLSEASHPYFYETLCGMSQRKRFSSQNYAYKFYKLWA